MGSHISTNMAFKILCLFAVVLALADASDVQVLSDGEMEAATCANPAKAGDKLTMDYVGTIDPQSATGVKGKKFDSSIDRGTPFSFTLGKGEVIKGWDQGLVGVCPGQKLNLKIPPA